MHKSRDKEKKDIVLESYYSPKIKEILEKYPNGIKTGLIEFYYSATSEEKEIFYKELKDLNRKKEDIHILINQIKSKLK